MADMVLPVSTVCVCVCVCVFIYIYIVVQFNKFV